MNIRDLALSNKFRVLLYILVLPLPWFIRAGMEMPLFEVAQAGNTTTPVYVTVSGVRNVPFGGELVRWKDCTDSTAVCTALLSESFASSGVPAAGWLFAICYYLSFGFLFFAGISLVKGISFRYLKQVKLVLILLLAGGYFLFYFSVSGNAALQAGYRLSSKMFPADWLLLYSAGILMLRLLFIPRQSGD